MRALQRSSQKQIKNWKICDTKKYKRKSKYIKREEMRNLIFSKLENRNSVKQNINYVSNPKEIREKM